jgi:hypothetical protein
MLAAWFQRVRPVFFVGFVILSSSAPCAEAPVTPYTVCEILHALPMFEGKAVAALGRYSFRQEGIWLGEQTCEAHDVAPPTLWLTEDTKDGPKPPDNFELDGATVSQKLADIRKRTSLGKFRFGSSDYDRWAVVYGRIATRTGEAAKRAGADLVFRGDGVVVFVTPN